MYFIFHLHGSRCSDFSGPGTVHSPQPSARQKAAHRMKISKKPKKTEPQFTDSTLSFRNPELRRFGHEAVANPCGTHVGFG